MKLIGLAGKRRSGKSTCARIIKEIAMDTFGVKVKILSYGFPLKQMFSRQFNVPVEDLDDPVTKEKYREAVIDYANLLKEKNPYLFVNLLAGQCQFGDNVVIDDVRTIEELEFVIKCQGLPYRVEADQFIRAARGAIYKPAIDLGLGETELDFSAETWRCLGGGVIYNNKDLLTLREPLTKLVRDTYVTGVLV